MEFHFEDDNQGYLFHRQVSLNGLVEISVYPVMFGFRVRCGFVGEEACELDWCAGNKWDDVQRLYSIALAILSKRTENTSCFENIPRISNVKPFFLDEDFTKTVITQAGELDLVTLQPIQR